MLTMYNAGMIAAILLGIVQGLTEFIPVSSSGHLVLFHQLLGMEEGVLAFDIALHVGTLLAVFLYFQRDIWEIISGYFKGDDKQKKLAYMLAIATIPAVIVGVLLQDIVDTSLRSPWVVVLMLAVFGGVMLLAENYADDVKNKTKMLDLTRVDAVKIGLLQACALVPGVSRSGATISAGLFLGMKRVEATRFSFLMALPIIAGASLKILAGNEARAEISANASMFAVGFLAAFISGMLAIRFLIGFVSRYSIRPFAYYRFVSAASLALLLVVTR